MQPEDLNLDYAGLQNHIDKISAELTILQRSLEECVQSWRTFGFAELRNPIAESLRHDIEQRKASLQRVRQMLADTLPA